LLYYLQISATIIKTTKSAICSVQQLSKYRSKQLLSKLCKYSRFICIQNSEQLSKQIKTHFMPKKC
jgi:hypothetical protein